MRMTRPEMTTLILPHAQAHALVDILDSLSLRDGDQASELDDVRQSLADTIWLCRWQREDVSLELRNGEVGELSETLLIALRQRQLNDGDRRAVQAIVDSLTQAHAMPIEFGMVSRRDAWCGKETHGCADVGH